MLDTFLFAIFPYMAVILAIVFGIHRYLSDGYSYSSLSTQFLESRKLFWGSVPWHYGIILILLGHLLAVFFPNAWVSLVGEPIRLYIVEVTGLALGFVTIFGIGGLIIRRIINPRIRVVTSAMDWVLLLALLMQVLSGVYIALFHRWGSVWFVESAQPWLKSLVLLEPQVHYIAMLPWVVKLHIFGAFLLVLLIPFTRLVHLFSIPLGYLIRPRQIVIWNKNYPWNS
jgi:nitrate reductase gamma subunit